MTGASWGAEVFDRLYAEATDPWQFETSEYERGKYAATLAALPADRRFRSALEIGCSIGVFTAHFAARCDRLLAIDLAEAALARARHRCQTLPQVRFEQRTVPQGFPAGQYDAVLLSEVLYFLADGDVDLLAHQVAAAVEAGGVVLLVNWTGPTDTPNTGDAAAERFIARSAGRLSVQTASRQPNFRLDLLIRD